MSELDELYQEVILDHTKHPRNFRDMPDATRIADGHNRLCGDKLRLFVKLNGDVITDVSFKGAGCSISTSSASMMTDAIKGKSVEQARELFAKFHHVLTLPLDQAPDVDELGKLAAFGGVRKFPVRVKCATLAWHTLAAALKNDKMPVSTE
ncbi:MAG: Fe-S cluster assembly sulfur transfer protein SufU [Tepidisphaeraceae bacterium]